MRLICPNCSAQYEIDASLIPDEGRDVQCSNCGHTWFELPPPPPDLMGASEAEVPVEDAAASVSNDRLADTDAGPDVEEEAEPVPEPEGEVEGVAEAEPEAEPVHEPEQPAEPDEEMTAAAEPEEEPATETRSEDEREPSTAARAFTEASEKAEMDTPDVDPFAAAAAAGAGLKRRRPADDAALEILREEAERELSQRRAPPSASLETQTDMPLDTVGTRRTPSRALRARMARENDDEPSRETPKPPSRDPRVTSVDEGFEAPRRDLLPDIDEINSSLKSRKGRGAAEGVTEAQARKGFRAGFLTMVGLALLLILVYAWAPAIARTVPSLETPLLNYVDGANGLRDWIDGLFGGS